MRNILILALIFCGVLHAKLPDQVYVIPHSGSNIAQFSSIDLSKSNAVGSSVLAIANGGTNHSSVGASRVIFSNSGATAYTDSTNLTYSSGGTLAATLTSNGNVFTGTASSSTGEITQTFYNSTASRYFNFDTFFTGGSEAMNITSDNTTIMTLNRTGLVNITDSLSLGSGVTLTNTSGNLVLSNGTGSVFLDTTANAAIDTTGAETISVRSGSGGGGGIYPIMVSANPSTNGLITIRGTVENSGSACSILTGEGFSTSYFSNGCNITFTNSMADAPAVVVSAEYGSGSFGIVAQSANQTGGGFTVVMYAPGSGAIGGASGVAGGVQVFNFIAMGQRNQ
jgi:hypothetical protein